MLIQKVFSKQTFNLKFLFMPYWHYYSLVSTNRCKLVKTKNSRVLIFQDRPGRNEKIFRVIKFKSINDKTDVNGVLLPDTVRLTPVSKKIRAWSLDELPQLMNVLKGDMSLVGPRPLLERYLPLYSEEHRKRHFVRPGITGLAQVSGRNTLSWSEKFDLEWTTSRTFH